MRGQMWVEENRRVKDDSKVFQPRELKKGSCKKLIGGRFWESVLEEKKIWIQYLMRWAQDSC